MMNDYERIVLSETPHVEIDWEGPGWYTDRQQYDSLGQFTRWIRVGFRDGHTYLPNPEAAVRDLSRQAQEAQ